MSSKQSLIGVVAAAFIVLLCGTGLVTAQQPDQSPPTTTTRDSRDNDRPDFGWIGLLGLAGLAGLLGRRREYGRDTVRTTGRSNIDNRP
jgi:MYXO-CTERM domain-containing protein